MGRESMSAFFFKYIDKILLAGVVALIGVCAASMALSTSDASMLRIEAAEIEQKIASEKENASLPAQIEPDFLKEARKPYERVPEAVRGPEWFSFKRPAVMRAARFVTPPKPLHFAPELTLTPDVGEVKIEWKESPENENIDIEGYELYRKENNNWKLLKQFGSEETGYLDEGLGFEQKYEYRIVSIAKPVAGADAFVGQGDAKRAVEKPVVTKFNIELVILGGNKNGQRTIMKLLRPGGVEPVEERRTLQIGKEITIKGFDSGWMVSDIGLGFIEISKLGCEPKVFRK